MQIMQNMRLQIDTKQHKNNLLMTDVT